MKEIFRTFLQFNQRERNGLLVFFLLIVALATLDFLWPMIFPSPEFHFQVRSIDVPQTHPAFRKHVSFEQGRVQENVISQRFYFDPNTLSDSGWLALGLNLRQIKSIRKFLAKGGVFRNPESLKKMYCIKEELFLSLQPYIRIMEKDSVRKKFDPLKYDRKPEPVKELLELNTADSAQLVAIKGIGPYFAAAIIRYRERLGGYQNIDQLLEINHVDEERLNSWKDRIRVDSSLIRKIDLNLATEKELIHPYLSYSMAKALVNYRKLHGKFQQLREIMHTDLLDEERYRKIVPYLKLSK